MMLEGHFQTINLSPFPSSAAYFGEKAQSTASSEPERLTGPPPTVSPWALILAMLIPSQLGPPQHQARALHPPLSRALPYMGPGPR